MSWSEEQLDFFAEKKYLILDEFLSSQQVREFRKLADDGMESGQFKEAGIGKGIEQKVVKTERGDWICWLDENSTDPVVTDYWNKISEIHQIINRNFYLGLNDMEAHLAVYQAGGFYKRHSDRHQKSSSRRLSLVLYLNETWQESDGGQLIIYLEGETVEVAPLAGRLVVFMSELEHEVLPTQMNRYSVTGWAHHRELI
jgi:SM-20-related protein